MSFTVFLGNLPAWVTADDIKSWLTAENLVADQIKVIRNPETQESKGFAFIDAPNQEEMQSIIRRFDRAPLEDRLLRANPAQPPKGKRPDLPARAGAAPSAAMATAHVGEYPRGDRPPRRDRRPREGEPAAATAPPSAASAAAQAKRRERKPHGPQSAFAEELAKAL